MRSSSPTNATNIVSKNLKYYQENGSSSIPEFFPSRRRSINENAMCIIVGFQERRRLVLRI